jgi:hypothetical protein
MPRRTPLTKTVKPRKGPSAGIISPNLGVMELPPPPLQEGGPELLWSYGDWRRDWTHIVSGKFTASPYSDLLFYEQSTRVAEFYATDGAGASACFGTTTIGG